MNIYQKITEQGMTPANVVELFGHFTKDKPMLWAPEREVQLVSTVNGTFHLFDSKGYIASTSNVPALIALLTSASGPRAILGTNAASEPAPDYFGLDEQKVERTGPDLEPYRNRAKELAAKMQERRSNFTGPGNANSELDKPVRYDADPL